MKPQSADLRTIRTHKAIRSALETMILTKDFNCITVKELAEIAGINRKTFYLHYDSLDDLFGELEDEIVDEFAQSEHLKTTESNETVTRDFFRVLFRQPELHKRLICSPGYFPLFRRVQVKLFHMYKEHGFDFALPPEYESLLIAYFCTSITFYQQWVADGEKLTPQELTDFAVALLCDGLIERIAVGRHQ